MTGKFHIYLQDEVPKVGSGWRVVIAKIGYKWVYLKMPSSLTRAKITRKKWDAIRKADSYEPKPCPQGFKDAEIQA